MEPLISFDIVLPRPGSRQRQRAIHAQLRTAVLEGRLKAGVHVPSSRALAQALGVARITVVAAYDLLVAEGYFVVRRGAGTFVAALPPAAKVQPRSSRALPRHPVFSPLARPDIRPVYASVRPRPQIDFTIGAPDLRQLRFDVWNRFAASAMRLHCRQGEDYGDVRGSARLRSAIAAHVSVARAVSAGHDGIVVTCGAQQAITLLAQIFVEPGKTTVAIEDPGYPPAFAAFAASGAKVVGVPVDPEGLVVERIPAQARLVYVTPSHQFPLGVVMSRRRRAALLDFAAAHDAVIVEDDYDSDFRFGGRPLDALQTMDRDQRVFYVGTFSKSLLPSVRIGFVVAPAWATDALVAAKHRADWHTGLMAQEALAGFIGEGHLSRHVRRMQRVYAARRELILTSLARDFGPWLRAVPNEAGLHVTAMTAPGLDAGELARAARAVEVGVYEVRPNVGTAGSSYLMFGFGRTDEADIAIAMERLRRLLSSGAVNGAPRKR